MDDSASRITPSAAELLLGKPWLLSTIASGGPRSWSRNQHTKTAAEHQPGGALRLDRPAGAGRLHGINGSRV